MFSTTSLIHRLGYQSEWASRQLIFRARKSSIGSRSLSHLLPTFTINYRPCTMFNAITFPFGRNTTTKPKSPLLISRHFMHTPQTMMTTMTDKITIEDLEVQFHVGVPDEERAKPQKLLITIKMWKDLGASVVNDDLSKTIDYAAVCQAVIDLGKTRHWKLIETLASDICNLVLEGFQPTSVSVTVKKFILPETRWVSVQMFRPLPTF